ncbi:thioredoxin family protein [Rhizobiaceae bacterium n13]|uniref:Thioredoxin family protein n=1 Tax=Ferirhizobium litorale TaxID=2927786 RepID=A0AAE3QGX7_9HYPH|nr:thioredoxin family protein [Fererhizobium litorale]MDI7862420.1 thioredoxin family protein [Fererhizobium litorale]MDI7923693.1 thioredoxin family protein [Fererhizobium litorale]
MPLKLVISLLVATSSLAGAALADEAKTPKGVVELFTSQGCASCPPADIALKKLVEQGDVVALAYHVDYWNYLGWADTLGSKENTERQYAYARSLGRSNVYTPQAVINGRDHMSGADLDALNRKLDSLKGAGKGLVVDVSASLKGDELAIDVAEGKGKANVVVVYFDRGKYVSVESGENTGQKIPYWHSVTDIQTVGMWDGSKLGLTLPANMLGSNKKHGCAVLLQAAGRGGEPGPILGAAVVEPQKQP